MAGVQVRPGFFRRRAMWRWCLAGGGAAFILLGFALGIPSGGASTGRSHRSSAARSTAPGHVSRRDRADARHTAHVTTTTSNASTGLGVPLPVGSSDGTSLGSVRQDATTLPSAQALGVVDTPPAVQSVPITTTAAVLITVIGFGAFGAGWTIGRRRAIPQG